MATKGDPRDRNKNNRPNKKKNNSSSSGGKNSTSSGPAGHSKGGNPAPHATPPKSSTTNSSGGGSGGINAGNSYGASAGGHSSSSSSSSSSSRGSSNSSRGSSSSSNAAALANARAQSQLRELQAKQEAQRKKVEQQAYANLLQTKYNRSGSSGIEKNPYTGAGAPSRFQTNEAARRVRQNYANSVASSGGNDDAGAQRSTAPSGSTQTTAAPAGAGMYASDRWGGSDNTVVLDIYGNYITQGKLNELKAQGYYDNWKEKAHSLDGTDKTYGWQYAVGNNGDPSGYGSALGNGIYSSNSLPQFGDEGYFYTGIRDNGMLDAQDAYTDAALRAYRDQIPLINQGYDGVAQEAYAAYMRARSGLPEQASGMATGMADSLLTQNDLTYQNNLSANELARAAALADLNTQAAQTQAQGELQKAQYQAQLEQQAYERKLEMMRMAQQQALAAARSQGGGGGGGSDMTPTQALKAYEMGIRTPEVMSRLDGFYGTGWQTGYLENDRATSQGQMSSSEALNVSGGSMAKLQQLLQQGKITISQYYDLSFAINNPNK